ncbi:MAG: AmmeMemoRadiSam system protein A [Thermodesulfobacteriota bacterium]|nr:AmmeMemoRadiSam system protein A [Thermodesulfobacteriota bacterium]
MEKDNLSLGEKQNLLALARWAIGNKLKTKGAKPKVEPTPILSAERGVFVSLHKHGRLRGCIGNFSANIPLTLNVEDMARAAAFEDPRFPPLSAKELPELNLEISVLTPMRRVENLEEIEVGRHGIYIIQGSCRGVLLPQVATEQGWDRDAFLENTCLKAGLGPDCWQDRETEIHIFSAEVFGEKELETSG